MDNYVIQLVEECNKKCSYCYQHISFHLNSSVNEDSIDKFLLNKKIKNLSIIGGEPLLYKSLVYYILEKYSGTSEKIILYTNFTLANNDDLNYFMKFKNLLIIVGIDLFKLDTHIQYNITYKNIIKAIKLGINISSNTPVSPINNLGLYLNKFINSYGTYLNKINHIFIPIYATEDDYTMENLKDILYFIKNYPIYFSEEFHRMFNPFIAYNDHLSCFKDTNFCLSNCETVLKYNNEIYNKCLFCKDNQNIKTECNECKFKYICRPCNFDYNGNFILPYKCKRMMNILHTLEFDKHQITLDNYRLTHFHINLGNKCNKKCTYCYEHKRIVVPLNLKMVDDFLKRNHLFIEYIDNIVGGEPLLYLNKDYDFLFKYFNELHITTNGLIINKYIKERNFKLHISIDSLKSINNIQFDYYKDQIRKFNLILTEDVILNFEEVMNKLYKYKKPLILCALFSYDNVNSTRDLFKRNMIKITNILRKYPDIVEFNLNHKLSEDYDCYKYKFNIEGEYLTRCEIEYNFSKYNNITNVFEKPLNTTSLLDVYNSTNNKYDYNHNRCYPKTLSFDFEDLLIKCLKGGFNEKIK